MKNVHLMCSVATLLLFTLHGSVLADDRVVIRPVHIGGRLGFSIDNGAQQPITVGGFELVPPSGGDSECPNGRSASRSISSGAEGVVLTTSVDIASLKNCVDPNWKMNYQPGHIVGVSNDGNRCPACPGGGSYVTKSTAFVYRVTISGQGWETVRLGAGYLHFAKS